MKLGASDSGMYSVTGARTPRVGSSSMSVTDSSSSSRGLRGGGLGMLRAAIWRP
jgi:hypothetical protein